MTHAKFRGRSQKGQALTEFVLIFPIVILILMGTIDFGVLLHKQILLEEAVRDGARSGCIGRDNAWIKQKIADTLSMSNISIAADDIDITVYILRTDEKSTSSDRTPGNHIVVQAELPDLQLITPIGNFVAGMASDFTLQANARFIIEGAESIG